MNSSVIDVRAQWLLSRKQVLEKAIAIPFCRELSDLSLEAAEVVYARRREHCAAVHEFLHATLRLFEEEQSLRLLVLSPMGNCMTVLFALDKDESYLRLLHTTVQIMLAYLAQERAAVTIGDA